MTHTSTALSSRCLATICLGIAMLALTTARAAEAQASFTSSLTATVIITPNGGHGKQGPPPGTAGLGCQQVVLQWMEHAGATRYAVYASPRSTGPWTELPAANLCGPLLRTSATKVVDTEPTTGAPALVHRLYYKVVAFGGGAESSPVAVTEPVAVEFP